VLQIHHCSATAAISDPAEHLQVVKFAPLFLRSNAVASLIAIVNHDIMRPAAPAIGGGVDAGGALV